MTVRPLTELDLSRFDDTSILKQLNATTRVLAELKGVARSIPHQGILINTLTLQEAKDSSEIESIITTHDELYSEEAFPGLAMGAAAKEVHLYRQALRIGYDAVRTSGLIRLKDILAIQTQIEAARPGLRKLPGTVLSDQRTGRVVYTPPAPEELPQLMGELDKAINDAGCLPIDPLIRMALIHHQFESIHPFYDGNGRTGRILNVLYLVKESLLDAPILYLSRYIVRTKAEYYALLQSTRDRDEWERWVLYILKATEIVARDVIGTIGEINEAVMLAKHRLRTELPRVYSQDLLNNLFTHPYTKIEFVEADLQVSRITATRYLEALVEHGFLTKQKRGRSNFYMNMALLAILTSERFTRTDAP